MGVLAGGDFLVALARSPPFADGDWRLFVRVDDVLCTLLAKVTARLHSTLDRAQPLEGNLVRDDTRPAVSRLQHEAGEIEERPGRVASFRQGLLAEFVGRQRVSPQMLDERKGDRAATMV